MWTAFVSLFLGGSRASNYRCSEFMKGMAILDPEAEFHALLPFLALKFFLPLLLWCSFPEPRLGPDGGRVDTDVPCKAEHSVQTRLPYWQYSVKWMVYSLHFPVCSWWVHVLFPLWGCWLTAAVGVCAPVFCAGRTFVFRTYIPRSEITSSYSNSRS